MFEQEKYGLNKKHALVLYGYDHALNLELIDIENKVTESCLL